MGYSKENRDEYWGEIKKIHKGTDKNDMIIWATDNNGQIAKREQCIDHPEE